MLTKFLPKILLGATIYFCLWFGLGSSRLWDRDEPRNARCAMEMLERNDWVVPMFNGELRTHKPILLYWLQMPSFALLGQTDFAARFGSAAMASLAVIGLFLFVRRNIDRQTAFWSAATLSSSLMFVVAARAATPDACLLATTTIGILCLAQHWIGSLSADRKLAVAGYFLFGLAILAKGPVGIVLPLAILVAWGWFELGMQRNSMRSSHSFILRHWLSIREVCRRLWLVPGLMTALVVAAPWYLWVGLRTDGAWLRGFFVEHNLGRAMQAMEGHQAGIWFYPLASLVGLFPWSLLMLPICHWTLRRFFDSSQGPIVRLGVVWFATYVAAFSLAQTKLPSYITPSYPGVAMLIGGFLADWSRCRYELGRYWLVMGSVAFIATGIGIVIGLLILADKEQIPQLADQGGWAVGLLAVGIALVFRSFTSMPSIPTRTRSPSPITLPQRLDYLPLGCLASAVFLLAGVFGVASPIVSKHRDDLELLQVVRAESFAPSRPTPVAWFALRAIEPSWVYYLQQTIGEVPVPPQADLSVRSATDDKVWHSFETSLASEESVVIVDGDKAKEWKSRLEKEFKVQVEVVGEFATFLKNDQVAVLQTKPIPSRVSSRPNSTR